METAQKIGFISFVAIVSTGIFYGLIVPMLKGDDDATANG